MSNISFITNDAPKNIAAPVTNGINFFFTCALSSTEDTIYLIPSIVILIIAMPEPTTATALKTYPPI